MSFKITFFHTRKLIKKENYQRKQESRGQIVKRNYYFFFPENNGNKYVVIINIFPFLTTQKITITSFKIKIGISLKLIKKNFEL